MTNTMEQALEEISKLSEQEQDVLGAWILAEIASERRWAKTFAASENLLEQLANEALAQHDAGKTQPLDLDKL